MSNVLFSCRRWYYRASLRGNRSKAHPFIILIVADDLGYGDLGCCGSKVHDTPNIDALAASGMRLTDFHSAGAMCSPTRASLLTGLYPQRFGGMFDGALSGTTQRQHGLPLEAETIAERLREKGYATGCFGKWHLGYRAPFLPTRQGFDVFRGLVSGDGDFHTQIDRSGNEDWWHNETLVREEAYTPFACQMRFEWAVSGNGRSHPSSWASPRGRF
ncbi:sulfatase-like hydrolase/transferase [Planctomycetes bacterium TBK1r]|uniref:Arylsulfatase n=1 Tax=Stieleria magnilauensis TaxID=2527963 RepID=A0ABX5XT08_9BACT|nr:Arylsulfatase [Planctomycetes bacterium TBK1r]